MYVVQLFASTKGCCLRLFCAFLCFCLYLCCGCCVFLLCALVLPLAEGVTGWARRSPGCLDNYPGHITHNQDPAIYSLLLINKNHLLFIIHYLLALKVLLHYLCPMIINPISFHPIPSHSSTNSCEDDLPIGSNIINLPITTN